MNKKTRKHRGNPLVFKTETSSSKNISRN